MTGVYKSIADGFSSAAEFFPREATPAPVPQNSPPAARK
jgi:hypothetical protein